MVHRKQDSQLNNSLGSELYSSTLRKIAVLFTSCPNPETLFATLHSYLQKVLPLQKFTIGLIGSSQKTVNWIFTAENSHEKFEVLKSECKPFWSEALAKKQSIVLETSKKAGLIEICSPIILYSQNLGIIKLQVLDNDDMPKYLQFIDLVAFFLAFIFKDLMIEDGKLVRQNIFHNEFKDIKQLNEKLLSVIDVARSLAHELNQPLTGISGYCTLALETINDNDSQSIKNDLENILKQASRLENLIYKFQSIAHIEGRVNKTNHE